jgi:hypothetical protein
VVISEEVEILIPIIRAVEKPKVHLITYAAAVTKNMQHFNGLSYYVLPPLPVGYTIPEWFSIELGIFAGRLYFNFPECAPLMKYLQLENRTDAETQESDGEHTYTFTKNPFNFLLDWLTLCRKGQDIMRTPMGYVCQGRALHENHPFFLVRSADATEVVMPSVEGRTGGNGHESQEGDTDLEGDCDSLDHLS